MFLILIPGLIFRSVLYQKSLVVRPFFSSGTVPTIVAILFYSSAIYAIAYGILLILSYLLPGPQLVFASGTGVMVRQEGIEDSSVREYFLARPIIGLVVLIFICILSYFCAIFVQMGSIYIPALGGLMYGPFARVLYKRRKDNIFCTILTNQIENNVAIMYQGVPIEVSLNERNGINHIVLKSARRFNMSIEKDTCSVYEDKHRSLSSSDAQSHHDILFVDGVQIANAHFDYFSIRAISHREAIKIMTKSRKITKN